MEFETREASAGNIVVIQCPERVDLRVSEELRSLMKEFVKGNRVFLVVDMGRTEFMDSTGLGALVSRIAVVRANNGDIRLAAVKDPIRRLLGITNLDQIFQCYKDVETAIASFES